MFLDEKGEPILSNKAKIKLHSLATIGYIKNKYLLIASVISLLAILLSNVATISSFIDKNTVGSFIEIPVEISNARTQPVRIDPLLDLYISNSLFYAGRLIAGEQPTDRVSLEPKTLTDSYKIEPNKTIYYTVKLSKRRYKDSLSSGGANGVFVLHTKDDSIFYYIEVKFHPKSLDTTLIFSIN